MDIDVAEVGDRIAGALTGGGEGEEVRSLGAGTRCERE